VSKKKAKKKAAVRPRRAPKRRRKRKSTNKQFADKIQALLDLVEAQYESETSKPSFYSAVTVVSGAFVWAMRRGCPPACLKEVMSEALSFALRTEGVPVEVLLDIERVVDPKEVN
jgi:hypothetical protein